MPSEEDIVPFLGEVSVWKGGNSQEESEFSSLPHQRVTSAILVSEKINGNIQHQLLLENMWLCREGVQRRAEV